MIRARSYAFRRIASVNYHLWQACNMACKFCFATFDDMKHTVLPAGHLNKEDSALVVRRLAEAGFRKINFAGGEPLLCAWLPDMVAQAREYKMATSMVTNGSLADRPRFAKVLEHLDWVALSVDSVDSGTLIRTGRVTRNGPMTADDYLRICERVKAAGVRLKINTVVTSANKDEDLTGFIRTARPERWKIMQMLPMAGPDSRHDPELQVGAEDFARFVRHSNKVELDGIRVIAERSQDMKGSYVMVDPAGRFYDNVDDQYSYSQPILAVGADTALSQVRVSKWAFHARGGLYEYQSQGS
ncbi:viperin family antiviral radical SAM protein [Kibdelosporangium persicum]|uniref:S-adenosylmethionine-dependent nucleotide dehydratase n=1 Tax=Kibdelosporangium persicum TaxID=2698649 RepID=A0ABX2F4B8_9PSEU|nr:viperin family antiviral radical SAM protein [Kibdelosporangium persicum]NRN66132.1 Molybdenum cofactor biosynthesis enzyme [Kibdelosporangium persicum]